ncbi:MAG: ABC transporter ATP-binding protein [Herpetosiphonaceae bacterium]|nr:MAG: ABC transporter ATP-binding protein [Herpetosiphonaceae bacterium]
MAPLLEVKDLKTYFYTQDGVVRAVDGVSFSVNRGETLGIVGESGSGKSVTSLSIMRLIPSPPGRIVGGEILFDGENLLDLDEDEMRKIRGRRISMIFQDPMTSLNPVLTIGRQMTEPLQLHLNMSASQARKRAIELLSMVGIPSPERRLDDYPHQFSGGMRQRVMIAMAISCNPELLIADEPTTALDVTIQAQILELINRLKNELDTAVIIITHDLGVVAGMADKVQVMYAGRVVEEAPTDELYHNPRMPYTIGLLDSIPRLDEHRGARLTPIRGLPPDLIDLPPICPFSPRCDFVQESCLNVVPPLRRVGPNHRAACLFEVTREQHQQAAAKAAAEGVETIDIAKKVTAAQEPAILRSR